MVPIMWFIYLGLFLNKWAFFANFLFFFYPAPILSFPVSISFAQHLSYASSLPILHIYACAFARKFDQNL